MARYSRRALKDLEDLNEGLREKAKTLVSTLDAQPSLGKKLKGQLEGIRSVHLGRSHRILYRLEEDGPLVLTIGWRKDIYR